MTPTNQSTDGENEHPKWTVVHKHRLVDSKWESVVYEFFDDKLIADRYYKKYLKEGTAIVVRPYYRPNDSRFLSGRKGVDIDSVQDRRHSGD